MSVAKAQTGPPRRRTQAERSALAKQRMIDAALVVISQKGYSLTTLEEIGKVAGYSRGLAHHHFGSKLKLMEAVAVEMKLRMERNVLRPAPAGQRGLDAVFSFVEDYIDYVVAMGPDKMRTVLVLLFESLAVAPEIVPIVADMSAASRSHISARIARGIADGTIRPDINPDVQGMLIAGLLRNAAHEWWLDPAGIDLGAVKHETLLMLRSRLSPGWGPRGESSAPSAHG
jgi:AcrR family transcriptional regulator